MVREKIDKDGNVITVGDLVFEDGILGQGSTASVRLARRIEPPKPPELVQVVDASAGKTIPNEFSAVPSDLDPSLSEKDELVPKTIASPTSTLIRDDVIETHDLTSQKPLNPPQSEPSIPSIQTEPSVTSSEESSDEKKTKSDVHDLVEKVGSTIVKVASDITANGRDTKATSDVQELVGTFGNKIADVANDLVEKASDIAEKATSTIQQVIQKEPDKNEKKDELVAVKIFNKSILKRMRTMERDSATRRMRYRTAFENVEKEIAIMKRMRHPNIVRLIEVIDSEDSDSLYMVLEYVPKGEIMTFIPELECFKRMPKKGEDANNMAGVVQPAGYFDETHAALYFVDILHGLAYLHQHHICHRDLKPENILLDANGVVKITDLGVSHFFEDVEDKNFTKSSLNLATGDATNGNGAESYHRQGSYDRPLGKLNRTLTESALSLKSMSSHGLLKKTEGTYCFWSPEMCSEDSSTYSGYAADMWAAGVCLITLATGKLPYYSEDCLKLFDMIADDEIDFEHFVDCAGEQVFLSNNLKNLMSLLLTKDPDERAGVGDCLSHPFLRLAREQRLDLLSDEFERSKLRKLIISEEDIRKAFAIAKLEATTAIVSKYIKLRSKLLDARATISQRSLKASESDSSITSDVSSSSDAPGVNSDVPSSLETPGFLTQTNDILNNNKAFRRSSLLSHVSEETFMSEEQTRRSSLSFGFEQTWNPNQRETEQEQDDQGPGMEKMGFLNENDSIVSEGDADTLTNLRNQSSRGFKMFKSRSMEDLKNFKTKSTRGLKRLKSSLPFRGHYSKFDSDDSETKWWKGRKLKNILRRFRKKAK